MARTTKPLTNTEIEKAKPKIDKDGKPTKNTLTDGQGLFLLVTPNGSKLWRFNYYKPNSKKRTEMSLGTFPNVSLQDARIKRAECRELLVKGIDPQDHRKQQQQAQQTELLNTYEAVAWTWFKYRKSKRNFSEGYQKDVESLIRRNLLPHFVQTRYLILWQLLTMTRPNEAATAKYEDIDESSRIWTVYIQKGIKQDERGREHKITLSRQAMALLREIKKLVAEMAGLTQSAISQVGRKESKPQKKTREKLAKIYNCLPEQLSI